MYPAGIPANKIHWLFELQLHASRQFYGFDLYLGFPKQTLSINSFAALGLFLVEDCMADHRDGLERPGTHVELSEWLYFAILSSLCCSKYAHTYIMVHIINKYFELKNSRDTDGAPQTQTTC